MNPTTSFSAWNKAKENVIDGNEVVVVCRSGVSAVRRWAAQLVGTIVLKTPSTFASYEFLGSV